MEDNKNGIIQKLFGKTLNQGILYRWSKKHRKDRHFQIHRKFTM